MDAELTKKVYKAGSKLGIRFIRGLGEESEKLDPGKQDPMVITTMAAFGLGQTIGSWYAAVAGSFGAEAADEWLVIMLKMITAQVRTAGGPKMDFSFARRDKSK